MDLEEKYSLDYMAAPHGAFRSVSQQGEDVFERGRVKKLHVEQPCNLTLSATNRSWTWNLMISTHNHQLIGYGGPHGPDVYRYAHV